jgi:hypothetical protein
VATNIITDPSFELESWTLGGDPGPPTHAFYTTSYKRTGAQSLELRHGGDPIQLGHATSVAIDIENKGESKTIGLWIQCERSHAFMSLLVWHYPNGTGLPYAIIGDIESTDVEGTTWINYEWDVNPAGTDDEIHLRPNGVGGFAEQVRWRIDDVYYADSSLAVKLAERSIDAVVSLLQSNLAAELTAIDTERADGVTMAAPPNGNYYKYPKAEIGGGSAHISVYESAIEFDDPDRDAAAERATYDIPLDIKRRCRRRDEGDLS